MKGWNAFGLAMQLSWTLLFSLVIPLLIGIWLDKRTGLSPLYTLIGVVVGVLAATLGVARMVIRTFRSAQGTEAGQGSEAEGEEEPS